MYDVDYTQFTEWNGFLAAAPFANTAGLENAGRHRVNVERGPNGEGFDGRGMWYRFPARPNRCNDQIVGQATINLPAGTRHLWIELDATFSANYTNVNPNCSRPAPDYKFVLPWFAEEVTCGHPRATLNMGTGGSTGSGVWAAAAGHPQCDEIVNNPGGTMGGAVDPQYPPNTVNNPIALEYFDGQPHTYRAHWSNQGGGDWRVYVEIDGVVTHDYVTDTTPPQDYTFDYIMLGSNRNLGATEDMYLIWHRVKVWAN